MLTCISKTPIPDRDLLAYLDGESKPAIASHLAVCPACAERLRALQATEATLRQTLYRADCPSAQVMADFRQGFLTFDEQRFITSHLAICPHCAAELARLDQFLGDIEPDFAVNPVAAARVLVARLVDWGRDAAGAVAGLAMPRPAFGAVRGDDHPTRLYQAEDFQIVLDVEVDPTRPGRRRIQGLVTQTNGEVIASLVEAHLLMNGQPQATAGVDELGDFAFGGLTPGNYGLTLVGPGLEVRIEEISIT